MVRIVELSPEELEEIENNGGLAAATKKNRGRIIADLKNYLTEQVSSKDLRNWIYFSYFTVGYR